MKGKSTISGHRNEKIRAVDAETVAAQTLGCLAADPDRLGRFLALTGLNPATIRQEATKPGFLSAVLDYVASDETLLLAIASESGIRPEEIAAAQVRMSGAHDEFS